MARLGIPAVLIGLFTWLLWEDRLGAASFTTLTGGALVVGLALQFGGRLREIDIKGKLILDKMETVKKDVYAKAESVARLAEDVVEAAVFSATKMNRLLDGKHLHQEMLKVRDRMSALLQDSGAGPEKVEAVVKTPINQTIIHDLKSEVRRAVGPAAKGCGEADTVQKWLFADLSTAVMEVEGRCRPNEIGVFCRSPRSNSPVGWRPPARAPLLGGGPARRRSRPGGRPALEALPADPVDFFETASSKPMTASLFTGST